MTIRFPKMHIAESVANRILNIADGVPSSPSLPMAAPVPPDVPAQGVTLDTQLATPPAATELPAGADGALVGAALAGDDLANASLSPVLAPV
jgi:hypothetical protein